MNPYRMADPPEWALASVETFTMWLRRLLEEAAMGVPTEHGMFLMSRCPICGSTVAEPNIHADFHAQLWFALGGNP